MRKFYLALLMLPFLNFGQNSYPTNGLLVHIPVTYGTVQNLMNNGTTPVISNTQFDTNRTGLANGALLLPNAGSVFHLPYTGNESNFQKQELTMALWFMADSIKQTYFNLMELRMSFFLRFRIDQIIQYGYKHQHGPDQYNVINVSPGNYNSIFVKKWNHLAVTTYLDTVQPSGTIRRILKLFLNGQILDSSVVNGSSLILINYQGENSTLAIGTRFQNNTMTLLNGKVDDIFYYNRKLSNQEILNLYNSNFVQVQERSMAAARIYPNPASSLINITYDGLVKSYRIYDLTGRLILHRDDVNSDEFSVVTEFLKSGTYFIEIMDAENRFFRHKFSKN